MLDGVAGSNSVSLVSLRCVIGPENLRHPLNQSGAKFGHLLSAPATVHVFSRSSLSVASSDIYSHFRSAVVLPLALVECQSAKLHSKSNKNICKSLPTILIRNYFVKMA